MQIKNLKKTIESFEAKENAGEADRFLFGGHDIGGLKVLYNETEKRYYNEENVPDGINSITTHTSDIWYNMHGMRITAPTENGIYIKNGKKVVVSL